MRPCLVHGLSRLWPIPTVPCMRVLPRSAKVSFPEGLPCWAIKDSWRHTSDHLNIEGTEVPVYLKDLEACVLEGGQTLSKGVNGGQRWLKEVKLCQRRSIEVKGGQMRSNRSNEVNGGQRRSNYVSQFQLKVVWLRTMTEGSTIIESLFWDAAVFSGI